MFNKCACLDLEAHLIRMLAGYGAYRVFNRNDGIIESNYYQREAYREAFNHIFDHFARDGVFTGSISEIEGSDLFELSPFKALTEDQATTVQDIVEDFLLNVGNGTNSTVVVEGGPGTGKTVVAIYLLKLIVDISTYTSLEDLDKDSHFAHLFTDHNKQLLRNLRVGLVIPQQSLRESIKKVFQKTPGLDPSMVLTPFDAGRTATAFDLLVVDDTHRLNQRASQASGVLNAHFTAITIELFGSDDTSKTQLDWVRAKSRYQIFIVDVAQSVRPADLPFETLSALVAESQAAGSHFQLTRKCEAKPGQALSHIFVQYSDSPGILRLKPCGTLQVMTFACLRVWQTCKLRSYAVTQKLA